MRRRREVLDDKKVFGPADDQPEKETILTLDKSLEKKLEDMKVGDPYIGTTIDERYLLHEKLGAGGMGAVYRATHVLMDKPVAIKLISRELTHLPQVVGRFEREARSASRLSHPHCITVTDFGRTEDGTLYLVMELLDGEPLEDMLNRLGTLPPPLAIHFTKQILDGLGHAHEAGIVHRDLKPANVMIVNQGEKRDFAIVFDFGIAKIATDTTTDNKLTQQGMIVGTPAYISPEQALGDDADNRADLYAVGVMLYEMLTGDVPYRGAQAVDVVTMHISAEIPSLPPGRRYPFGLRQVIEKAMAKKPTDRYQTADEFLSAMMSLDFGNTEFIRKKGRRTGSLLFVLLGILILISSFGVWYHWDTKPNQIVHPVSKHKIEKAVKPEPVSIEVTQKQVADLLAKADEQIRLGIPMEAVNTAKEALKQNSDEPMGYLLLGHALFLSNRRLEAMTAYEKALKMSAEMTKDERLLTHLKEALKWDGANEKSATMLSEKFGSTGVELLKDRANSALSDRDERNVSRKALIAIGKENEIDWVATLTADFNDFKACAKRRQIIHQMEETKDPRFLPLLEAQRPAKGRWMKAYKCIEPDVEQAIRFLKAAAAVAGTDEDSISTTNTMILTEETQ